MTKRRIGAGLVILGAVLVIVALALTRANILEDANAGEYSIVAYGKIESTIQEREAIIEEVQTEPEYKIDPNLPMPVCEIDGWGYIGILTIPAIDKSLAVMDQWTYAGLKLSPGRYSGSAYTNDLIICGHNYQSHFGQLQCLVVGDEVAFTDMDGNRFNYEVSAVETLEGTDISKMNEGDWDLTLYTCTIGGKQRVTVRCKLAEVVVAIEPEVYVGN